MLKFFNIEQNYINFLKTIDRQIPDINYSSNVKFVCGIVMTINEHEYYAPISHFNRKQATNLLIYNSNNLPIASIRCSFMFPALKEVLTEIDISSYLKSNDIQTRKYGYLMHIELQYCQQNTYRIYKKCSDVYKIGTDSTHRLNYTCCNFKLLEENYKKYNPQVIYPVKQ